MAILGQKWISTKVVKAGDRIKFVNAGDWKPSNYKNPDGTVKNQFVIEVEKDGAIYQMSLNKTNREALIFAFGNDTDGWVEKSATIDIEKCMVGGEKKDIIILQPALEQ